MRLLMFDMLFGIALSALISTYGWNRIFKKLEPPVEEPQEEENEDSIVKEAERELQAAGIDTEGTEN